MQMIWLAYHNRSTQDFVVPCSIKPPVSLPGDVFQQARDKIGLPANVPLALYEEVHAGRTDELTPTKLLGEVCKKLVLS